MPELPEVEHAVGSLRRFLAGAVVERAEAEPTRVFRGTDRGAFERDLAGTRLARVDRYGKYLTLVFCPASAARGRSGPKGEVGLLSHLGMSGKWVFRRPGEPAPSHSRARIHLRGGGVIHYHDPRLFGRIAVMPAAELGELPELQELGPDALRDGVSIDHLAAACARSSRPVKVVLMDQAVIAGLGNIYATDVLFRARVHPARSARELSRPEVRALARAIKVTIARALALTAGDEDQEIDYLSESPGDEARFLIYGRAGEPCSRCRTIVEKLELGGRTSAYCPGCQQIAGRSAPGRARSR